MIFQDPFACLHPMHRVGDQIAEAVTAHVNVSSSEASKRAVDLLQAVGIPNAKNRARDYPHQFSGGMRQRAMIAMALVHNPSVLIADEPTTALDVTVQAQILELIERVKLEFDIGVILITHDLGVIAETAETVLVMYAGRAMEYGPASELLGAPQNPYTWGLLGSMPTIERRLEKLVAIEGSPPSMLAVPAGLLRSILDVRTASLRARRIFRTCSRCQEVTSIAAISRIRASVRSGRRSLRRGSVPPDERDEAIVELEHVTKHFPVSQGVFSRARSRSTRSKTSR